MEASAAAFCMTIHLCCSDQWLDTKKYDAQKCKSKAVRATDSSNPQFGNDCDQWGCSVCSRILKDVDPKTGKWVEPGHSFSILR